MKHNETFLSRKSLGRHHSDKSVHTTKGKKRFVSANESWNVPFARSFCFSQLLAFFLSSSLKSSLKTNNKWHYQTKNETFSPISDISVSIIFFICWNKYESALVARHWPCADASLHGDSAANEVNHCTFLLFCFVFLFADENRFLMRTTEQATKRWTKKHQRILQNCLNGAQMSGLPLLYRIFVFALDEFRFLRIFRHSSSFLIVLIRIIVII